LTPAVRDRFLARSRASLFNQWGPTEATVYGTYWECARERAGDIVPIGHPLEGKRLYVLSSSGGSARVDEPGELFVGGDELAIGYRNKPRQTALAFMPDRFDERAGARLYASGDLARWNERGWLEYLGRRDHQIQLRGIRIELGEIEAALEACANVVSAAVVAPDLVQGKAETLVAYVVLVDGVLLDVAGLRDHLARALDASVIPSRFVALDDMPKTASGKIDRNALPDPDVARREAPRTGPRNETEAAIASIWRRHLGLEELGVDDLLGDELAVDHLALDGRLLDDGPFDDRGLRDLAGDGLPLDERLLDVRVGRGRLADRVLPAPHLERFGVVGPVVDDYLVTPLHLLEELVPRYLLVGLLAPGRRDDPERPRLALDAGVAHRNRVVLADPALDGLPVRRDFTLLRVCSRHCDPR